MSLVRTWPLVTVFSFVILTGQTRADDFERFKAENQLKAQKLTSEVSAALTQARDLERSDPATARQVLRRLLLQLEDANFLPERQRLALEQQVRARISQLTPLIRTKEEAETSAAAARARAEERPAAGQTPKGSGVGDQAKDRLAAAKASQEAQARIKAAKELGFNGALRDVENSAAGTIEQRITDRFVRVTALRLEKLTKEEKAILKALNSTLSVDFDGTKFKQAIEYLQDKTGMAIIIDQNSMKEAMVEYDDPVTLKVTKVGVRTILRKILQERGLTYIIKDNSLLVVSTAKAREMMVTRTYAVADLIMPDARLGPLFGQAVLQQNVQALIQMIQNSVDPSIWQSNQPGSAAITFHAPSMSLVVRAPAEIHYMLGFGGMGGRR